VDNVADFFRAGADAVGVGSALINQQLLEVGDFATLTARARRFREAVEAGRSSAEG
jgi:2-dehydro-3-deoxyphosphogluconate aldolase/(4S)-4-hydroxy-2-oxoglutarate aldolase